MQKMSDDQVKTINALKNIDDKDKDEKKMEQEKISKRYFR